MFGVPVKVILVEEPVQMLIVPLILALGVGNIFIFIVSVVNTQPTWLNFDLMTTDKIPDAPIGNV